MSHYCPEVIYVQTRFQPAETCDVEVPNEGDFCPEHDYTDEDAADDAREHDIESRKGY